MAHSGLVARRAPSTTELTACFRWRYLISEASSASYDDAPDADAAAADDGAIDNFKQYKDDTAATAVAKPFLTHCTAGRPRSLLPTSSA